MCLEANAQVQSDRSPSATESLFSCVAKRKVTKREGHPAYALSGLRATAPALPQLGHPCPRLPGKSAVGLRGLSTAHPVLTPNWPASLPATLRAFPPPARRFRGAPAEQRAILARTFQKYQINSTATAERRFALAVAFSFITECGPRWPAALPGVPCAAVRRGRQAAQRASTGMSMPFRQHMDVLSKSPAPAHGLAGQDARQAQEDESSSLLLQ
jgi:hypothetical protein